MCTDIILDINNELLILEEVFKRYLEPMVGCKWVPTLRYPLSNENIHLVNQNVLAKYLSDVPYHPILCVDSVYKYVYRYIYIDKELDVDVHMFKYNELIPKKEGRNFLNEYSYIWYHDDCLPHIMLDKIRGVDCKILRNMLDIITNKVKGYTDKNLKNVYDLDFTTNLVILKDYGNIGMYRYNEALNYIESLKD